MADTRITRLFARLKQERRKGFIAYITAGDPSPERTPALVDALDRHGVLLDEQALTKRRHRLIRHELLAAIVVAGGLG